MLSLRRHHPRHVAPVRGRGRAFTALVALTASTLSWTVLTAAPASAAPVLTVRPTTWNVLGLDSNNPGTTGPDTFPVGARVCNTGTSAATGLSTALVFESANSFLNTVGPTTITFPELAPGACTDTSFNVRVTRTAAAFDTARRYRITASATGTGTVSTPTNRELYVEKLISQNRNSVLGISGSAITTPPSSGAPGSATVYVGQTYDFTVRSSTATGGYEQLESFLDFPSALFQILKTATTYTQPTGATNDTIYADACGWDNVIGPRPSSGTYLSCKGPANYPGGKAGGSNVVTTFTVKVLAAGSGALSTLIYDFSGSSFHYNSDFGANATSVRFTAVESPDLAVTKSHAAAAFQRGGSGSYLLTVTNSGAGPTTGPITLTDTLPAGLSFVSASGTGYTCSASGQTVTCSNPGPIDPAGTRPLTLNVAVAANAPSTVINRATVATANDANRTNDSASDPTATNSPPVAVNDVATTRAGTPVSISVLANDTDPDGNALTVTASTAPGSGAVTCSSTSCTFTPAGGFVGTTTFAYTVSDGRGGTDGATVSVTVANSPPVFTAAPTNTRQTVSVGTALTALAATDADGDALSYVLQSGSLPPRTVLNADGTFGGLPTTPGTYTVVVQVTDGNGGTATTELTIVVNDPRTASIGDLVLDDRNGNGAADSGEPGLQGATVILTQDGATVATTTTGATGAYSFTGLAGGTYVVDVSAPAGYAATVPATRTVVLAIRGTVTDADFAFQLRTASLAGLLFSDVDGDGTRDAGEGVLPGATVTVTGGGTTTTLTTDAEGRYGLGGLAAGSYLVSATLVGGQTATTTNPETVVLAEAEPRTGVDVGIRPANTAPVAVDDAVSVVSGGSVTFDPRSPQGGAADSDPDGDPLTLTSAYTQPANGAVSCTSTSCTYSAVAGAAGADTFTYTITDGRGGTAQATVTVTVLNAPPVFTDAPSNTSQARQTGDPLAPVVATDVNGDPLTYSLVDRPGEALPPGVTAVAPDGSFTGAPTTPGTYVFTVGVSDGEGGAATTTLTVVMSAAANTAPTAVDDARTTAYDTAVQVLVLANDTDPTDDPLTVTTPSPVLTSGSGTIDCSPTSCTFTPTAGFTGPAVFAYSISDGRGGSASAQVTITVQPRGNQAPEFAAASSTQVLQVVAGTPTAVLATDDASGVTYSTTSTLPAGVTLEPNGTFTGSSSVVGDTTVVLTATDAGGLSAQTTLLLRYVNGDPVFTPANQDQTVSSGSGLAPVLASDPNGDPLTYTLVSGSLPPRTSLSADGTFSGTTSDPGTYVFSVGVTDGRGGTDVLSVRVVVTDPATASIGDLVFDDRNGSGVQAATEPGLEGVQVQVRDADGTLVATATTAADGSYRVPGLLAGPYTVRVLPGAFTTTTPAELTVTLTVGQALTTADFGLQLRTATLSGTAFFDTDRDEVRDAGETTGFGGLLVTLTGQQGTVTTTTATDGAWTVGGLPAGTYAVTIATPDGQVRTTPQPLSVPVAAGQAVSGADAGFAPANTPPTALDDTVTTTKGDPVTFAPLANDTDAETAVLVLRVLTDPADGSVRCTSTGCTYTPSSTFSGVDSFTYDVTDGGGLTDTATVRITVENAPPTFTPAAVNTRQTVTLGAAPQPVRATDADGDALVYSFDSGQLPPGTALTSTGAFTGAATQSGTTTVVLRVTDTSGASTTTTLVVVVPEPDDLPPAYTSAEANTSQRVAVGAPVTAVSAVDPEGQAVTYVLVDGTLPAGVTFNGDGTFSGSPTTPGVYALTIEARDPAGQVDTTVLTITVPNESPVFSSAVSNDAQTTVVGGTLQRLVATDPDATDTLTYRVSEGLAPDGVFLNPDGTFTGGPTSPGTTTFTITVEDGVGGAATTVLTVTAVDRAPQFTGATTNDDQTVTVGGAPQPVVAVDPDGSAITYAVTTGTLPGTLALGRDGTFTGATTSRGTTSVTITATDATGSTTTTDLTIVVVGSPPVAADDSATTRTGDAVVIAVTANDTDADGDARRIVSSTAPASGSVTCGATSCTYAPRSGFTGTDTFTYTVSDGREGTDTARVTVSVVANRAPTAVDDAATAAYQTATRITVLGNDTDPEGDRLTVTVATQPADGSVTCDGTTCTYVPAVGFVGSDTFTYAVADGRGGRDTATVRVTVTSEPNVAPNYTAAADNTAQTVQAGDVLAPVVATDADDVRSTLRHTLTGGSLPPGVTALAPDGSFVGSPTVPGSYSVTVTVTDPSGASDVTTVTLTVTPAPTNADPAYTGAAQNTSQSGTVGDTLSPLLATDPEGGALTYTVTGGQLPPTVTLAADGTFDGTLTVPGTSSVTVTVTDPRGGSDSTTLVVVVAAPPAGTAPVFTPPDFRGDDVNTAQTVPVGATVQPVVATDAEGGPVTYAVTGGALPPGVTSLTTDGTFVGSPTTPGSSTVEITARDPQGLTDVTVLVITVPAPANRAPVGLDDDRTTQTGTPVTVAMLVNDTDADGDELFVANTTDPTSGTIACDATTCTYTPDAGFAGTDTFTYVATDSRLSSASTTVTVTVLAPAPGNAAPAFTSGGANRAQTVPTGGALADVVAADADDAASTLAYVLSGGALPPGVTGLRPDGSFTGSPTQPGTYGVEVTVTDPSGASDVTTLVVTVPAPPANGAPVAVDDGSSTAPITTAYQSAVTIRVLINDTDPDGDALTVAGLTQPATGSVTCTTSTCTYVPGAGATGLDTFTYTIADGHGATATATVTVEVGAEPVANTRPTALDDGSSATPVATPFQSAVTVPVLSNDTDADGDRLTVVAVTQPSKGSVTCTTTTCTYLPAAGTTGLDTFTYTVADGRGGSDTATVTVEVGVEPAPGAAPVAAQDAASTAFQTPVTVSVLGNDTDPDGDTLQVVSVTQPASGTASCAATSCAYVPQAGFTGTDTFTYTVADGTGGTATATVTVTVRPNTPPVAAPDSATTAHRTPVTVAVLGNDSDADGGTLAVTSVTQPANGSVSCTATTCTYVPEDGFSGTDVFTYSVSDGLGGSSTTTVTVVVRPVPVDRQPTAGPSQPAAGPSRPAAGPSRPAANGGGADSGPGARTGGSLARTGGDTALLAQVAGLLLAVGAGLALAGRRRRRAQ